MLCSIFKFIMIKFLGLVLEIDEKKPLIIHIEKK